MTHEFAHDATDEMYDAYRWYEKRTPGLGEEFLRSIESCIELIKTYPNIGRQVDGRYRRVKTRRFPYDIFYEIVGEVLVIQCVFHNAQNPDKWRKRLSES